MSLRPELQAVVERILEKSAPGEVLTLDAIGNAIGTLAVSTEEIDVVFVALEHAGRAIQGHVGTGSAEAHLKRVVSAVRGLKAQGVARPNVRQVAEGARLEQAQVLSALYLLRIMQRG